MDNFVRFVLTLNEWGIADVIFPAIILFLSSFVIFQLIPALRKERILNYIVFAFIFTIIIILPHVIGIYPIALNPINIINSILPNLSIIMIIVQPILSIWITYDILKNKKNIYLPKINIWIICAWLFSIITFIVYFTVRRKVLRKK
jgi:hypothetical protein